MLHYFKPFFLSIMKIKWNVSIFDLHGTCYNRIFSWHSMRENVCHTTNHISETKLIVICDSDIILLPWSLTICLLCLTFCFPCLTFCLPCLTFCLLWLTYCLPCLTFCLPCLIFCFQCLTFCPPCLTSCLPRLTFCFSSYFLSSVSYFLVFVSSFLVLFLVCLLNVGLTLDVKTDLDYFGMIKYVTT